MDIIQYLLDIIQDLYHQICWLVLFICKYIPLRQWDFDDSHSPKYQKFKVDTLPKVVSFKQDWDWNDLIPYYRERYGKTVKPVFRRGECDIPEDCTCPACNAPFQYLLWNDGRKRSQLKCKVCQTLFSHDAKTRFAKTHALKCPYCSHTLVAVKDRKHFTVHKCVNLKCPYYLHNLKKVDREDLDGEGGNRRYRYKLHYIYREFNVDFFRMDPDSLPKNASSLRFTRNNAHIMGLCLTLRVNLGLSLRKTSQAMRDLYGISVSHQQVANYCRTAAVCVKPFVDHYDYGAGDTMAADETYIKIRGVKAYVWFVMDAAKRSILGYRVSDNRGVGPCILAMRQASRHLKELPKGFRFIADGYSAYPLAAQQFLIRYGEKFRFNITQVIGLANGDAVSKEFRPYKQMVERLNRTYKASYRPTNGFDNIDGANYDLALWVAYYNFLRPHRHNRFRVLNEVEMLEGADNMPGKWQLLIFLGQQTIQNLQEEATAS